MASLAEDRSRVVATMPDSVSRPRPSIRAALERQVVIWLSSICPDSRPHLVPLWFVWDGASILAFSKPKSQKVRNLRHSPRVMVGVGEPGIDFDVELVEALAELEPHPTRHVLPDAFATKYGRQMARLGSTPDRFAEVYSQPIRIRPTRWLDWGGSRIGN